MAWIFWVLLSFQELGASSQSTSLRRLEMVRQDAIERDGWRGTLVDDRAAKAAARRAAQAMSEAEFVNRFNKAMHAMADFARAYDQQHTIDVKQLKLVKAALRDLERNDGWFRDPKTK